MINIADLKQLLLTILKIADLKKTNNFIYIL